MYIEEEDRGIILPSQMNASFSFKNFSSFFQFSKPELLKNHVLQSNNEFCMTLNRTRLMTKA